MGKRLGVLILTLVAGISTPAHAAGVDGDAVIGGAIGAAAGAAVGSAVGGREGAIVGGGLGGAAGAAVATAGKKHEEVVVVRDHDHHRDNGRHLGHHKKKHKHDNHKHGHDDHGHDHD